MARTVGNVVREKKGVEAIHPSWYKNPSTRLRSFTYNLKEEEKNGGEIVRLRALVKKQGKKIRSLEKKIS